MCAAPKVSAAPVQQPTPEAPVKPTPVRDSKIESTYERRQAARRTGASGLGSTFLSNPNTGGEVAGAVASPKLGG